jgi:hypothetical protein
MWTHAVAIIETSVADRAFISLINHQTATSCHSNPSMDRGRERSRRRPHGNIIEPVRSVLFFSYRIRKHITFLSHTQLTNPICDIFSSLV